MTALVLTSMEVQAKVRRPWTFSCRRLQNIFKSENLIQGFLPCIQPSNLLSRPSPDKRCWYFGQFSWWDWPVSTQLHVPAWSWQGHVRVDHLYLAPTLKVEKITRFLIRNLPSTNIRKNVSTFAPNSDLCQPIVQYPSAPFDHEAEDWILCLEWDWVVERLDSDFDR